MTIEIIAGLITSITSIVAIAISVYSFKVQTNLAAITLSVTMLREYEREFFRSVEMKKKRWITANFLLKRASGEEPPAEAYDLLDFFDTIGQYVNRGAIDLDMTWNTFHYWFDKYWFLLSKDVNQLNEWTEGVCYLDNCSRLYGLLNAHGKSCKKLPPENVRYLPEKLETFLRSEMDACDDWNGSSS